MSDTALEPRVISNPATGEQVALDRPDIDLVVDAAEAQEMRHRLRVYENLIGRELLARMDRKAEWTIRGEHFKATGRSPEPPAEWDEVMLRAALAELVEHGLLDGEAAKAAVRVEVTYKPQAGALKKLHKLGGEVAQAIDACRKEPDPEWARSRSVRVSVVS